jgi:hypothetical protein
MPSFARWLRRPAAGEGFRVRSSGRDDALDAERFDLIIRTIERVEADIARERAGLTNRLEEAKTRVSALVGSDTYEYLDRDDMAEKQLRESELQMAQASRRLRRLDEVLGGVGGLKEAAARLKAPGGA